MKETKYLLNLQMFADPEDGNGNGNQEPQEEMVSKKLFDKQASEIASLKKQLKAKQTDDEAALEAQKEKDKELDELRMYKQKTSIKSGLTAKGISDKEAETIADAILSGEADAIAKAIGENFEASQSALQKEIDTLKLSGIEKPGGSSDSKETTVEDFAKMDIDQRIELKNSNPELFKILNEQHKKEIQKNRI